jgi:hypothetical protein
VSPVKYELGFYIPEDDILHSHRRENLKSYAHTLPFSQCACKQLQHACAKLRKFPDSQSTTEQQASVAAREGRVHSDQLFL